MVEAGERLVQLGAYPTEDLAREEWDRIAVRFGDFMEGKGRVIQEDDGGRYIHNKYTFARGEEAGIWYSVSIEEDGPDIRDWLYVNVDNYDHEDGLLVVDVTMY